MSDEIDDYRERKRQYEELERQRRYAEAADARYENWGRDSDAAYEEWASR
jgi:hypothetical protein